MEIFNEENGEYASTIKLAVISRVLVPASMIANSYALVFFFKRNLENLPKYVVLWTDRPTDRQTDRPIRLVIEATFRRFKMLRYIPEEKALISRLALRADLYDQQLCCSMPKEVRRDIIDELEKLLIKDYVAVV